MVYGGLWESGPASVRIPRPGDILGALTGDNGVEGNDVGKIQIFDLQAYVAVKRSVVKQALKKISEGKLKGRTFKVRQLR